MTVKDAMTKVMSPEYLNADNYIDKDRALAADIFSHPDWPSIRERATYLFQRHPESTINMLIRFGWDVKSVAGEDSSPSNDVSWCEALFTKQDPRPHL